jgi:hypothetical protein
MSTIYFIEIIEPSGIHEGYIALSLDKAKQIICSLCTMIANEDYSDDPDSWIELTELVNQCDNFSKIASLVYDLAQENTSATFRLSLVEEGEDVEPMS